MLAVPGSPRKRLALNVLTVGVANPWTSGGSPLLAQCVRAKRQIQLGRGRVEFRGQGTRVRVWNVALDKQRGVAYQRVVRWSEKQTGFGCCCGANAPGRTVLDEAGIR